MKARVSGMPSPLEVVYIDSEPPDAVGGGIRTYLRLALKACREAGVAARIYTHNPAAYPGEDCSPIGRKPTRAPWRGLAYRMWYRENVLWEHARWLNAELSAGDTPGRIYEFCDFLGYAHFALRNPSLRNRIIVRVHTPNFLVAAPSGSFPARLAARIADRREKECLERARHVTVPSAAFVRECLPWLRGWTHVPNPVPPARIAAPECGPDPRPDASPVPDRDWAAAPDPGHAQAMPEPTRFRPDRFLYLGRIEERKGALVAVRAFARLAAEMPFASLTLVGSGTPGAYAAEVRKLIDSQPDSVRNRLVWEPPCSPEARHALFARFTALIAPSLWENSPYVYFEGMAAGLHCIGSATGEMKEIARSTGALSVPPGDEEEWYRALRAFCTGKGRNALAAQDAYLEAGRAGIPGRMLAVYREIARGQVPVAAGLP